MVQTFLILGLFLLQPLFAEEPAHSEPKAPERPVAEEPRAKQAEVLKLQAINYSIPTSRDPMSTMRRNPKIQTQFVQAVVKEIGSKRKGISPAQSMQNSNILTFPITCLTRPNSNRNTEDFQQGFLVIDSSRGDIEASIQIIKTGKLDLKWHSSYTKQIPNFNRSVFNLVRDGGFAKLQRNARGIYTGTQSNAATESTYKIKNDRFNNILVIWDTKAKDSGLQMKRRYCSAS